jgi:hypothetical protein
MNEHIVRVLISMLLCQEQGKFTIPSKPMMTLFVNSLLYDETFRLEQIVSAASDKAYSYSNVRNLASNALLYQRLQIARDISGSSVTNKTRTITVQHEYPFDSISHRSILSADR